MGNLIPRNRGQRTVAAFNQQALSLQTDARLQEERARLYTDFVENRIMDGHEVAAFANAAMQTDLDRVVIVPIVQAYAVTVQRTILEYGKGL